MEDGGSRWSHGDELGAVALEVRMKGSRKIPEAGVEGMSEVW